MNTRNTRNLRHGAGFTVLELMTVVSIIGLLASVAIPSFLNYQLMAKRSEAFTNLSSLAKTQKSYFAEFNRFVAVAPEPGTTLGNVPITLKRSSVPVGPAFAMVGWTPEGDVFFDYDTNTESTGTCTCTGPCFTAAAYGDLDGDALMSILVFAEADSVGGFCPSLVLGVSPEQDLSGNDQFGSVVPGLATDKF